MKEYFDLQLLMTKRKIKELGIHPLLAFIVGICIFGFLSTYIFYKTEFAAYLLLLFYISLIIKLSEKSRSEFLSLVYGDKNKNKIRLIENLIISIPFLIVLCINFAFIELALLLFSGLVFAIFSFRSNYSSTIPTPFSKRPFEFLVGFRKSFIIFPIIYILTAIAITVGNYNLGLFSMMIIFLISLSFYNESENEYFVWIHALSPKKFLLYKLSTASIYVSILAIPVSLGLLFRFPDFYHFTIIFYLIGLLFLWTIILAKYSAYPHEMNLAEGFIIAFCFIFPPFLIVVLPYFYFKSINKLKFLIYDKN